MAPSLLLVGRGNLELLKRAEQLWFCAGQRRQLFGSRFGNQAQIAAGCIGPQVTRDTLRL